MTTNHASPLFSSLHVLADSTTLLNKGGLKGKSKEAVFFFVCLFVANTDVKERKKERKGERDIV